MLVTFSDKELERCADDERYCQWSCDLDQPYRLIFVPHENPIPTDGNGKYLWIEIKGVEVLEITNYHGK